MLAKQLYRNFFSFSRLFTWGQTTYGWGRPINEDYFSPGLVEGFKNIKKVDTGKYHIGFITEANQVYSCGFNEYGQTGVSSSDGDPVEKFSKLVFPKLTSPIVDISYGVNHSLALTADGQIYAWGLITILEGSRFSVSQSIAKTPKLIPQTYFNDHKIVMIGAGNQVSVALSDTGQLYAWGLKSSELLGTSTPLPKKITIANEYLERKHMHVKKIFCAQHYLLILCNNGKMYALGENYDGVLGTRLNELIVDDQFHDILVPVIPKQLQGQRIIDFECSSNSMVAITETGKVFYTGMFLNFQLTPFPWQGSVKKIFATRESVGVINIQGRIYFINDKFIEDSDFISAKTPVMVCEDDNLDKAKNIGGKYFLRYALVE